MRCVLNRFLRGTCVFAFALVALCSAKAQSDFKGFYVGGNAGVALGRFSVDASPIFSPTGYFASTSTTAITSASSQQIKPNGLTAGGQAGYNYQWDNFVLGAEIDFGRMDLSGATTVTQTYPCCAPTAFTVTQTAKADWLFTARPRIGFVFGPVLFYQTAGVAMTNVKYTALFTDTFATANESAAIDDTRVGWTAGGGAEVRVTHHISVKGEYLYAGFGTATVTSTNLTAFAPPIAFPSNIFTHTAALHSGIARGGVNFRF
jgi:outer membrane immunogenic protein